MITSNLDWTRSMLQSSNGSPSFISWTTKSQLLGTMVGCIGERSIPRTKVLGNWSATSIHHAPDPVPRSTIFVALGEMGAITLPPRSERITNCRSSRRWTSSSSFGRGYGFDSIPWYLLSSMACWGNVLPPIPVYSEFVIATRDAF